MGGTPPLPTASTPGYGLFRGRVACDCLSEWLPVLEALAIAKGLIKFNLDIVQLTGDADASAGVHSQGGAFDLAQMGAPFVALCREMGAPATWSRYWTGNYHTHGVLLGCPHNAPAAYQLDEQRRGEDGLSGTGSDPYPDPDVYRTWSQGIAWAKWQLSIIQAAKDLNMALTSAEIEKVAQRAADLTLWAPVFPGQDGMGGSSVRNHLGLTFRRAEAAEAAVAALSARLEESHAALLAAIADIPQAAVPAPVVDEDAIAVAVADAIAERLAG